MHLDEWREHERRIDAAQVPDLAPLLDRLPEEVIEVLSPLEALALKHSAGAYLRGRQISPAGEWMIWVLMCGRGFGKTHAAAAWMVERVLEGTPDKPSDFALVAPVLDDCWSLQWATIKSLLPPWVRSLERVSKNQVLFPDHGVTLLLHSAENTQYRGPNLRGAWCEEPVKWTNGAELWKNLRLALRVKGVTPPRAVFTTTPPREANWILDLCADQDAVVTRGEMKDNAALDARAVASAYRAMANTIEGSRELGGKVVLGVDGALFSSEDLDRYRVVVAPKLSEIVIAVDPAQSNKRDADTVGVVAIGKAWHERSRKHPTALEAIAGLAGNPQQPSRELHLYVLRSISKRMDPAEWAMLALSWAEEFEAGKYVVEPTGSGSYPRATLEAQIRIAQATRRPIIDSKAKGSKADRAQPLSLAASAPSQRNKGGGGRLHLVGLHEDLERELTTWTPSSNFSPGALDALVHGASVLTSNWTQL